ncbi:putative metal-binding motif-containing protein [Patescibacteria group bacterium]
MAKNLLISRRLRNRSLDQKNPHEKERKMDGKVLSFFTTQSLLAKILGLAMFLLLSSFVTTQAAAQSSGNLCIKEQLGGNPPCTANDVRFSTLDLLNGPSACVLDETVSVELEVKLESGPERYDIGLWINESGGSALSDPDGTCFRDYLHPVSLDNSDCSQDLGPYYNGPGDNDSCGDLPALGSDLCGSQTGPCIDGGGTCLFTFHKFTVDILCVDGNGNGLVDVGWATSWDNNAESECTNEMDTDPGTGSKCYTTDYVDLGGLRICTDNDKDGFREEGGECGPVDCDDSDPSVNPGAQEVCNGIDDNCDGVIDDIDADLDGYIAAECGGEDCNDTNPEINPGVIEGCCDIPSCFDNIDNDCDGLVDQEQDTCLEWCGGGGWMIPMEATCNTVSTLASSGSKHLNYLAVLLLSLAGILLLKKKKK